jgi:hypothetical protein
MENLFKAAGQPPPYNRGVDCSVYNSGNGVSKPRPGTLTVRPPQSP